MTDRGRAKACRLVFSMAHRRGMKAGQACRPRPVKMQATADPWDPQAAVIDEWDEPEGACGFAWVVLPPGWLTDWLLETGLGTETNQGVVLPVPFFGQSYERKLAYARTVARYLTKLRIPARVIACRD